MVKVKVWEKPTILVLGVEKTNDVQLGPCINPKHGGPKGHYGELKPMTPGHGHFNAIS